MKPFAAGILAVVLLAPGWAAAGFELSRNYPQVKEPVELTVTRRDGTPAPGAPVTATYGPGSNVLWAETIGATDASGKLSWTPAEAGLVTLSTEIPGDGEPETLSQNISVQFASAPWTGILVMAVAGFILYGGVIHGFVRLGRMVPTFPPDT